MKVDANTDLSTVDTHDRSITHVLDRECCRRIQLKDASSEEAYKCLVRKYGRLIQKWANGMSWNDPQKEEELYTFGLSSLWEYACGYDPMRATFYTRLGALHKLMRTEEHRIRRHTHSPNLTVYTSSSLVISTVNRVSAMPDVSSQVEMRDELDTVFAAHQLTDLQAAGLSALANEGTTTKLTQQLKTNRQNIHQTLQEVRKRVRQNRTKWKTRPGRKYLTTEEVLNYRKQFVDTPSII